MKMDRFEAQLTALEYFFLQEDNDFENIEKMEVTKVNWEEGTPEERWEVHYKVLFRNGREQQCLEIINLEDDDYMVDSLQLFASDGMMICLI